MAIITMPGMLLTGDHASRPAATAVGAGALYACSTHDLIYQSDGATWSTWADLAGTGGSVATDAIWDAAGDLAVGTGSNTAARLAIGATNGMVLKRVAGAVAWAFPPGHEFDYAELTSGVNITGTTETAAGMTDILTGNAATYDGEPVIATFFAPAARSDDTAGRDLRIGLFEGTTFLGRMSLSQGAATTANSDWRPHVATYRFTPSAASHTYNVQGFVSAGTGRIEAGAGGATNYVPAYLRITKV